VLGWRPIWNIEEALQETIAWYRELFASGAAPREVGAEV
jgi:nucleoside-diphosphate-sugar epimerase